MCDVNLKKKWRGPSQDGRAAFINKDTIQIVKMAGNVFFFIIKVITAFFIMGEVERSHVQSRGLSGTRLRNNALKVVEKKLNKNSGHFTARQKLHDQKT